MRRPSLPRLSRRAWIALAAVAGVGVAAAVGLGVVYPRVGAWAIRKQVRTRVADRLGRDVTIGAIDVSLGRAVLRDLEVRGPRDGDHPLVHVDRVTVAFSAARSLIGSVRISDAAVDGVHVALRRGRDGLDNASDLVERLRARPPGDAAGGGPRPTRLTVEHVEVAAVDEQTGATLSVGDGDAVWTPAGLAAHARALTAVTTGAPKASLAGVTVSKSPGEAPVVTLEGGELELWPRMALSGIGGRVVADPAHAGRYTIDLAGGWGGVPGRLWTAKGELDPRALTAVIDLEAAKFQLDRLAPILEHSAVVDYQATSVDTSLHLDADRGGARFAGSFHLRGLNVGHPMIADKEVHDLDLSADVAGSFDRASHALTLSRGDFVVRDVPFSITGTVVRPRVTASEPVAAAPSPATPGAPPGAPAVGAVALGPHGVQSVKLRLVIPPIDCQRVLDAIPTEMAPYLAGYKMKGVFDTDVHLDVDWTNLDALDLGGHVGIAHCRVASEPDDAPKRLKDEFEHYVEVDKGEWLSFVVGPTNPDFVPITEISPHLINSIMSTEDSGFYHHHGFITSEFRSALVSDLKARAFRYGASSITMQMVKNVLLYREKTLARKLQELFLTWDVENTLTKDRILEIYLNVIEYGPGLYGIGPAAHHYFGKPAKDLNPVEAAFFSSILPDPKGRYRQYCQGAATKWTSDKIGRILNIMLKRDRLTQEEYDKAIATPLAFVKDGTETEDQCLERVQKAIKHARPTNPLKK